MLSRMDVAEKIFVFRRSAFERLGIFQGFNTDVDHYLPTILDPKNNSFMPRAQAETNPDFKQIIPYVVITDGTNVLHYIRGKDAGEKRLVAKGSIGIGGHINEDQDHTLFAFAVNDKDHTLLAFGLKAFQNAVEREVCEELTIDGKFDAKPVGLINDDSTEVGRVHFGIVHVLFRTSEQVKKNERVITQLKWLPLEVLKAKRGRMETWSQLCLDNLDALLKRS